MNVAVVIACMSLAWAVWERRWTLHSTNCQTALLERSVTIGLIDMLAGIFLQTPLSEATVGRALHALTGQWNLDDFVGDCCLISSLGGIGLSLFARTGLPTDQLRAAFKQHVERPMTIVYPVALLLFWQSPNANHYWPDFFDCPTDVWLDAYWTLMCAFCMWLLGRVTWVLIGLRRDPRNRPVACLYLLGSILGILLCGFRAYTTWADVPCRTTTWWSYAVIAFLFAYSAQHSWRRRVDWFTPMAAG